ncbi:glycosyltransferase [Candidatus Micrarchaeota archaeon]|nr:glycosyltransferase [Candidatus Micrarchaeota archaeon]
MRILVFNAGRYLSPEGGAVRFKNLVVQNNPEHEIFWVDPVYSRSTYSSEAVEREIPHNVHLIKGFKSSSNPLIELWQREKHFLKAVKTASCDVAVFYNSWGTYLARRWLKKNKIPLVFDYIDLMHAFRKGLQSKVARWSVVQALKQADLVITTAQALFEDAKQFNKNVCLITNGVNIDYFAETRPKPLKHPSVGFVGSLGEWVDLASLLETARREPKITFYLVGDGPGHRLVEEAALPNVVLTGFVPYAEAKNYAASFDVCVVPFKKSELTDAVSPIKMFEYWALGKPVIAAPTREIKRLAGKAVIYASTPDELQGGIKRILEDKELAQLLSNEARKIVLNYDWRALGKEYLQAIETVISK